MEDILALNSDNLLVLFAVLVVFFVPGTVAMVVYRMLLPAPRIDWSKSLLQGFFYSVLHLAVILPIVLSLQDADGSIAFNIWHWYIFVLAIPILYPFLYILLRKHRWLAVTFQIPFASASDYYFHQRRPCFMIVHFNDGSRVAGYFGGRSYVTSYPEQGDIYLERMMWLDSKYQFAEYVKGTDGVIIHRGQYRMVELFTISEDTTHAK